MAIYTRKGDSGQTRLGNGTEISKDNRTVEAYGTIDELNSFLGLLRARIEDEEIQDKIKEIQKDLFTLGVEVSGGENYKKIEFKDISKLEEWIDSIEKELPPLNHFIIPGGSVESSLTHAVRTICRRAERRIVELSRNETIRNEITVYLNRLSDYLFVLARELNYKKRIQETEWKGKKLL